MSADAAAIVAERPPQYQISVQFEREMMPRRVLLWANGTGECELCFEDECRHIVAARAWVAANLPPAERQSV